VIDVSKVEIEVEKLLEELVEQICVDVNIFRSNNTESGLKNSALNYCSVFAADCCNKNGNVIIPIIDGDNSLADSALGESANLDNQFSHNQSIALGESMASENLTPLISDEKACGVRDDSAFHLDETVIDTAHPGQELSENEHTDEDYIKSLQQRRGINKSPTYNLEKISNSTTLLLDKSIPNANMEPQHKKNVNKCKTAKVSHQIQPDLLDNIEKLSLHSKSVKNTKEEVNNHKSKNEEPLTGVTYLHGNKDTDFSNLDTFVPTSQDISKYVSQDLEKSEVNLTRQFDAGNETFGQVESNDDENIILTNLVSKSLSKSEISKDVECMRPNTRNEFQMLDKSDLTKSDFSSPPRKETSFKVSQSSEYCLVELNGFCSGTNELKSEEDDVTSLTKFGLQFTTTSDRSDNAFGLHEEDIFESFNKKHFQKVSQCSENCDVVMRHLLISKDKLYLFEESDIWQGYSDCGQVSDECEPLFSETLEFSVKKEIPNDDNACSMTQSFEQLNNVSASVEIPANNGMCCISCFSKTC